MSLGDFASFIGGATMFASAFGGPFGKVIGVAGGAFAGSLKAIDQEESGVDFAKEVGWGATLGAAGVFKGFKAARKGVDEAVAAGSTAAGANAAANIAVRDATKLTRLKLENAFGFTEGGKKAYQIYGKSIDKYPWIKAPLYSGAGSSAAAIATQYTSPSDLISMVTGLGGGGSRTGETRATTGETRATQGQQGSGTNSPGGDTNPLGGGAAVPVPTRMAGLGLGSSSSTTPPGSSTSPGSGSTTPKSDKNTEASPRVELPKGNGSAPARA
ncbi:hypothetical protein [Nocardia panacis]|uniref:hypothetical protein n=1 Tax=Nocardia panacis TaxID=2340916 RepID=UPI0011C3C7FF|nr:hypothetical protein [Nocardia panacis]